MDAAVGLKRHEHGDRVIRDQAAWCRVLSLPNRSAHSPIFWKKVKRARHALDNR
jgi:hypothetical protein